jgi:hypothetical protein
LKPAELLLLTLTLYIALRKKEKSGRKTALAQWKANGGGDDGTDKNANSTSDDDGDSNKMDEHAQVTAEDFIDSD